MTLTALLSYFDEQPATLHRLIASLPLAGVTHLAALDGRYQLYECESHTSPPETIQAIQDACNTAGIALTLEQPDAPFAGNEIEKRSRLFALGDTVTTEHDWYLIVDADEQITRVPDDLHARLADSWFDVAEITYNECPLDRDARWWETKPFPKMFRAIRGLHCASNHYTYRTPDGRNLWGNAHTMRLEPRLPVHDMHMHHHHDDRAPDREAAKRAYYTRRHEVGAEVHYLPRAAA